MEYLGNPVYDKQYWISAAQSILTTPQDTLAPVIYIGVAALDGASAYSCEHSIRVTYHLQFFDLATVTIS